MFVLISIMLYLVAGTFIARGVNARQRFAVECATGAGVVPKALDPRKHAGDCYRNPSGSWYRPERDCDCRFYSQWRDLGGKRAEGTSGPDGPSVTNPYLVFGLWPVLGFHNFLTSGTYEGYNPHLTDKLEKELGMEQK